jgi:serine protease AprX
MHLNTLAGRRFARPTGAKLGITLLTAAFFATATWAKPEMESKADFSIRQQLALSKSSGWTSVIIKLRSRLTPEQSEQLMALDADTYRHLPIVQSLAVRLPNRNLRALTELSFVDRLSADSKMRKYDEFTTGRSGAMAAFQQYGLTGNGVAVAVVDSGIDDHDDLNDPLTGLSRVTASVSFVSTNSNPGDLCGHGTHVAGIIAGNGASSSGTGYTHTFLGVARKASLVNVRVLDAFGRTDASTVLASLQWVMNNRKKYGIRVVNMSLGHSVGESYTTDPLCQAVEQLWKNGVVVVVAAGNDGRVSDVDNPLSNDNEGYGTSYGSIGSPGNDPYVITVGAMKSTDGQRGHDTIATYSGRGPSRLDYIVKPDICAPGNKVISLRKPLSFLELTGPTSIIPVNSYRSNAPFWQASDYFELSGTSMATPVVSGAVALMLQSNPNLSPDTIKARLMVTADKWRMPNGQPDITAYGSGYLDIVGALNSKVTAAQSARSPYMKRDLNGNVFLSLDGVWGERAMWGTGQSLDAVFGSSVIAPDQMIFGSRAMWGTNEVWGNRAMWGTDQFRLNLGPITLFGE